VETMAIIMVTVAF